MNKKYKTAGIWNIVLGVSQIVLLLGGLLTLVIALIVLDGDGMGGALAFLISIMMGMVLIMGGGLMVPVMMILVGKEMLQGRPKGVAIKAAFVANVLFKLVMVFVPLGVFAQEEMQLSNLFSFIMVVAVFSIPFMISIVMDIRAFFQRKEKPQNVS